jgi:hypothetical protein
MMLISVRQNHFVHLCDLGREFAIIVPAHPKRSQKTPQKHHERACTHADPHVAEV